MIPVAGLRRDSLCLSAGSCNLPIEDILDVTSKQNRPQEGLQSEDT